TRPPTPELADSAFYSGIAIIAAFAWRLARGYANPNVALEYATGLVTAGAVLNHGWMEYRSQGNFDPELLAATYLFAALARGNPLPAAAVTWIGSFGRHLIRLPARGIVVRPALIGHDGVTPIFEVIVAPDPTPPDKITFFGFLPTLAFRAMTGEAFRGHANFLEDVRRVADTHDQVLEGVSDFRRGIRLRIRGTADGVAEP
ncbi:MAG TPA: hypothetical protein VEK14_04570, partial [Rhodomicrobium sp.]|nr:hypothetical protein [Rhodomicrobium sp.]